MNENENENDKARTRERIARLGDLRADPLVCQRCGSTEIMYQAYVRPNDGFSLTWFADDGDCVWCDPCNAWGVGAVRRSEYPEQRDGSRDASRSAGVQAAKAGLDLNDAWLVHKRTTRLEGQEHDFEAFYAGFHRAKKGEL